MAFFKFRKGGDEAPAAAPQVESVEALRRRARHRLIGAIVLVLAGVVGFPLLFDSQPRPIPVDIPIDIPDRNKVRPLTLPVTVPPVAAASSTVPGEVILADKSTEPASAPKSAEKVPAAPASSGPDVTKTVAILTPVPTPAPASAPEPKADVRPAADKAPAKADDGAKAQALLEGKATPAPAAASDAAAGRFVVQVGAFADSAKVRDVRAKVEKAGLKTYTQGVDTKDGPRTRVRVGPFADRAEADKVAAKIKHLGLPAAILTL